MRKDQEPKGIINRFFEELDDYEQSLREEGQEYFDRPAQVKPYRNLRPGIRNFLSRIAQDVKQIIRGIDDHS